jgi:hypothetical protein
VQRFDQQYRLPIDDTSKAPISTFTARVPTQVSTRRRRVSAP